MNRLIQRSLLLVALVSVAVPVAAGPADEVRSRIASYRQLGENFKAVNDTLRSGSPSAAILRQSATRIVAASRSQYNLFPATSRPQRGIETAALPVIWSDGSGFRARQTAFARQAEVFQRAAAGTDFALIRREARRLGATCMGCHDNYRADDD